MELKTGILSLNYFKNLFLGKTQNILPFPVRAQKPFLGQNIGGKLPRCKPEDVNVSSRTVAHFLSNLSKIKPACVHTAIIMREGKVICEAGFEPYSTKYWHVTHSLCKTFAGIAIGMLVDEGRLTTQELVCDFFPEKCTFLTPRRTKNITVEHLLTMKSGANFGEIGASTEKDWAASFFSYDCAFDPGSKFHYNSMNSYMLSAIVTKLTGKTLHDYLNEKLFEPLSFSSTMWESCPAGITKGGWGMYIYAEDALKVALLFLNNGVYNENGKKTRILSEQWIEKSIQCDYDIAALCGYGYQLWSYKKSDYIMFNGVFGQNVIISKQLNTAVAINAGSTDIFAMGDAFFIADEFFNTLKSNTKKSTLLSFIDYKALNYIVQNLKFGKAISVPENYYVQKIKDAVHKKFNFKKSKKLNYNNKKCMELNGTAYKFSKCKFGLFPVILSCMNDCYTKGLTQISFVYEQNKLFVLWAEEDSVYKIPVGFEKAEVCDVSFGGNIFTVATMGVFKKDEDDDLVLKLTISFLESSSTQNIKLFLPGNLLHVSMSESPNLIEMFSKISELSSQFIVPDTSVILKNNYISRIAHSFCYPSATSISTKADSGTQMKNIEEKHFIKNSNVSGPV